MYVDRVKVENEVAMRCGLRHLSRDAVRVAVRDRMTRLDPRPEARRRM
jgi:hypothetical protein